MAISARSWFAAPPPGVAVIEDARARRLVVIELVVVLTVTTGLSALRSALSLLDALLSPIPLARPRQQVTLNPPGARSDLVDLAVQLTRVLQLVGWGALGAYLLVRAGFALRTVGLDRSRPVRDLRAALGWAVAIGIPGLGLYLIARALGVSAASTLGDTWWRFRCWWPRRRPTAGPRRSSRSGIC